MVRTAEIVTVTGERMEATGPVVDQLFAYYSLPDGERTGLGWVRVGNTAINFNHVVTVQFKEAA